MDVVSNQLFVAAIFCYVSAMVAYAAVDASMRSRRPSPVDVRAEVLVGGRTSGQAPGAWPTRPPHGERGSVPLPSGAVWGARVGVVATALGAAAQAGSLAARGLAAGRVPWGNMYEFVIAVCLVGVLAWLVASARRPVARSMGLYVALAAVVLLGLAGMRLYTSAGPLVPALNSYWLKIHVTAAAVASGVFLIGFVAAVLYLLRHRYETTERGAPRGLAASLGSRLPPGETLERLSFRFHVFAFPLWTFAVIAGAIWAEAAWGRYWGWDPKEVWAFISWVIYAGYLHARSTPSVRRPVVAWIAVAGWASMMFNLFAVNLFIVGLHSYAGVN